MTRNHLKRKVNNFYRGKGGVIKGSGICMKCFAKHIRAQMPKRKKRA